MDKYTTYKGKFLCKTCSKEVFTIRIYTLTGVGSWMCSDKHLSKVQVYKVGYKNKRNIENGK